MASTHKQSHDARLYLLTWRLGYAVALDVADFASTWCRVALVRLVNQGQPRADELARIRQCKRMLLAVGIEFASIKQGDPPTSEFVTAPEEAERQFRERFGTLAPMPSASSLSGDPVRVEEPALSPPGRDKLALHGAQDLQSLLLHREAVLLLLATPALAARLENTLRRWRLRDDPNSLPLLKRWQQIIADRDWGTALADTEEAQQLRQASPLPTLVPEATRLAVIGAVKALKRAASRQRQAASRQPNASKTE